MLRSVGTMLCLSRGDGSRTGACPLTCRARHRRGALLFRPFGGRGRAATAFGLSVGLRPAGYRRPPGCPDQSLYEFLLAHGPPPGQSVAFRQFGQFLPALRFERSSGDQGTMTSVIPMAVAHLRLQQAATVCSSSLTANEGSSAGPAHTYPPVRSMAFRKCVIINPRHQ